MSDTIKVNSEDIVHIGMVRMVRLDCAYALTNGAGGSAESTPEVTPEPTNLAVSYPVGDPPPVPANEWYGAQFDKPEAKTWK